MFIIFFFYHALQIHARNKLKKVTTIGKSSDVKKKKKKKKIIWTKNLYVHKPYIIMSEILS